ncbi:MAG TPA: UDP-3-O-acyl-N-acetylglucosamine deacetylase [Chthonomonadaceae bacterium]|nr:UDP-3-O-acyl-N-acetylglucosamine deacetylase [Chthonomonadaceae bacterium]
MEQQTLAAPFEFEGIGIHTGGPARVVVRPAGPGTGRVFHAAGQCIPARTQFVVDTRRSTTLGRDGARLSTVEHLLSALAGCGIDNCDVDVEGAEIPILDGSAQPFVRLIHVAGIVRQRAPARFVTLDAPLSVENGGSELRAEPAGAMSLRVETRFDEWPEGAATLEVDGPAGVPADYMEAIAPARTFAFRREVDMLIAAGLAKGGSLDNALVIEPPDTFSSSLRIPQEWCAHKALDLIGDLALLDARLAIRVTALRPGHRINTALAQKIAAACR